MEFNPERLCQFWYFVKERQEIWYRRYLEQKPPPWTSDKILREVFFTNVYRELDEGTLYLLENVIDKGSESDELFEIMVYRLFNNRDTYDAMKRNGRVYGDWEHWKEIACYLESFQKKTREPVFTKAHMTTGIKWGGFADKISNVCWLFHEHWMQKQCTYKDLIEATSLEDLTKRLATCKGFGMFTGYEVATDMGYSKRLQRFSEDDWANPGPGCRKAIDVLMPDRAGLGISYQQVIRNLRENQREYFEITGNDFRFLEDRELTMRNIEHSLCEYYKYYRGVTGGKTRRKYHLKKHASGELFQN